MLQTFDSLRKEWSGHYGILYLPFSISESLISLFTVLDKDEETFLTRKSSIVSVLAIAFCSFWPGLFQLVSCCIIFSLIV